MRLMPGCLATCLPSCAGTPFEDLFDRGPKDPTQRPGRFGGGRSTPVTSADDVIGELRRAGWRVE